MSVKLLTEHYLSLKRACTGSSESTLVKCHIVGNHMSRLNYEHDEEMPQSKIIYGPWREKVTDCRPTHGTMRKRYISQTATTQYTLSLPQQEYFTKLERTPRHHTTEQEPKKKLSHTMGAKKKTMNKQ